MSSRYLKYLIPIGIAIGFLITRLQYLDMPFERDEGEYALFGRMILEGATPYLDFYENKPPLLYYSYAIIQAIFGSSVQGLHLGFYLMHLLSALLLFDAIRKLAGFTAGVLGSVTFQLMGMSPYLAGLSVMSEHIMIFFLCIGLWFLVKWIDHKLQRYLFLCGCMFGLALMTRQNAFFFIPAVTHILFMYHFLNKILWPRRIRNVAFYICGVALPPILVVLAAAFQGYLSEMIYWTIVYPSENIIGQGNKLGWYYFTTVFETLFQGHAILWILAQIGLIGVIISGNRMMRTMVLIFGLFSIVAIYPGRLFFGHYFIMILPGLALLVGVGTQNIIEYFVPRNTKRMIAMYSITFILVVTVVMANQSHYINPNYTSILRDVYGTNPFDEMWHASKYIEAIAEEGDDIVVMGSEPQVYFYTGLKAPSKHIYLGHLVDGSSRHIELQTEFIKDVEAAPPKFLIAVSHPVSWSMVDKSSHYLMDWYPDFAKRNYQIIGMIDINEEESTYKFGKEWRFYRPTSEYKIYLWKRKNS